MAPPAWILVPAAYLLGSVSFAILAAKRQGVDILAAGSGNPGATNISRVLGKRTGRLVLALDVLKGILPALAARALEGPESVLAASVGVAAVTGHIAPIWHRWRGGKGVATAAGVTLALIPLAGLAGALVYLAVKRLTGWTSAGSMAGAVAALAVSAALYGPTSPPTLMTLTFVGLIVVRHGSNLRRIADGEEPEAK